MEQDVKINDTTEVSQQATTPVVEAQETENPEQINWRKFREGREADRKAREAAEKQAAEEREKAQAFKAAMEALVNKPNHQQPSSYEEEVSEDEKIQQKINAALEARERQIEQEKQQREHKEFPQKLAETYKDFDQVCSSENLDYLEYHYPEVAEPFKRLPDGYDKWACVYRAVKKFVPNTDGKKEMAKAQANLTKPQSMSVAGVTKTGDSAPVYLDDKRKADNWARMRKVMGRV